MSQSSLNIANVTRTLYRSAVNSALQALASLMSESTEPDPTYAYMLWADTGSGKLKQRNAANDAWVEKGNLADVDWGFLNKAGGSMTGLLNLAAGADIASATTIDLTAATGNCPKVTGTTPVEAWTMNTGQQVTVIAAGALPLTYHATTNNIEGGISYTCAANDIIKLVKGLDGVVRVRIEKQDGTPIVPASFASASDFNTGTDQTKALNSKIVRENGWVYGSLVATTSGDPIEILTGLPAWVTEIEFVLNGVSLSGTNHILIQPGTASAYVTSGFNADGINGSTTVAIDQSTSGFILRYTDATFALSVVVRMVKGANNIWTCSYIIDRANGTALHWGAGIVDLGAAITRVRFNTDGANTFDSGSIIGRYR